MGKTAAEQLKPWLIERIRNLEAEGVRVLREMQSIYAPHGGISDDEENARQYQKSQGDLAEIHGQLKALRDVLDAFNRFATHSFQEPE